MDDYAELCRRCFENVGGQSFEDGIEACTGVIDVNRSSQDLERAYFSRGLSREAIGEFEPAIQDFDKAIAFRPRADYFQTRGDTLCKAGRSDAALADFARVIQLDPEDASPHMSLGCIHQDRGEHRQAVQCYDRAIELSPGFAAAHYSRYLAHTGLEEWEGARRDLDKAVELSPADPIYRGVRGMIELTGRRFDRARVDIDCALEMWPDWPMLLYLRGIARRALDDVAGAEADFARAQSLDPDVARQVRDIGIET